MGAEHVHRSRPRLALRATRRGICHIAAGGSNLGTRIRSFQIALRCGKLLAADRYVDQSHAEFTRRSRTFGRGTMTGPVIGFAGMTHLGLNSAVASAERGFNVICFDSDAGRIAALNEGRQPVVVPQLPGMFARHLAPLTVTADAGL